MRRSVSAGGVCCLALCLVLSMAASCSQPVERRFSMAGIREYKYGVMNTYPHDRKAFTQGLSYRDGYFYEGTGLHGKSTIRKIEMKTGKVLKTHRMEDRFFGEGIALLQSHIVQLTWKSQTGFIYDRDSFSVLGTFHYPTQGWGLTHDETNLIMSDGTARLYFLDPQTFQEVRHIEVHTPKGPVTCLNELEYIRGAIYANIYRDDRVIMISPRTGLVTGYIDLSGILPWYDRWKPVKELNGIAYDGKRDRVFITGKLWPKIFEITLQGDKN